MNNPFIVPQAPEVLEWHQRGICYGSPYPDDWYGGPDRENNGQHSSAEYIANAKAQCYECPVRIDCLEYAITTNEHHGVWGGVNFADKDERRVFRARMRGAA